MTKMSERFRVLGTTGDVTTCERCGRPNLRKTVALAALDLDGNEEGVEYLGSDCAARALRAAGTKATKRDIELAAAAADRNAANAREWAAEMGGYYGTVSAAEAIARYAAANRAAVDPAARVAAVLAEVAAINAGVLAGTRFDPARKS